MNHLRVLAEFICDLRYEDVPSEVTAKLRLSILDTLGCALHGAGTTWGRLVGEYAARAKGACPIWATGASVDAANAALANATMAHSFELDDLHLPSRSHPGGVTIPVVLALAAEGSRINGRMALAALAAGYELTTRVGMCQGVSSFDRGWHPTGTAGCFGSTATAAKVLGLSADGIQHSLGIGGTMPCGLMAAQYGAMVKRLYAGHAAMVGIMAARLAAGGFTGIPDIFDVEFGGYPRALSDAVDINWLTRDLGKAFEANNLGHKFYPCVGASHTTLDALKKILDREQFDPTAVEAVTVTTSEYQKAHAGWPYVPSTIMAAQMSIQYVAAVMLTYGNVFVESFTEDMIADSRILALAKKVRIVGDPAQADLDRSARVEVRFGTGKVLAEDGKFPRGHPRNPAAWGDIVSKFEALAVHALDAKARAQIISIVENFDNLDDINILQRAVVKATANR
jgi:2-methylcitrate dehydratase PrpD